MESTHTHARTALAGNETSTPAGASTSSPSPASSVTTLRGSCHCGVVQFEAKADLSKGASRCNCSICTKVSPASALVKPSAFKLIAGEGHMGTYLWASRTSTRYFCKHCGVHCFARGYLDVLGGDYVSVNLNAIDDLDVTDLTVNHWDGRHDNWMAGSRATPWPIAPKTV